MHSFQQFILESGNNPYPFVRSGRPEHSGHKNSASYNFDVDGNKYQVDIHHYFDSEAGVSFAPVRKSKDDYANYDLTGDKGTKATRIMSTIHHIVKHHVQNHPALRVIEFTSEEREPSRVSLYKRYTKHMKGKTENYGDENVHRVPASSYR